MRMILELVAVGKRGRRVVLTAGEELRIGRTAKAEFAIPGDGHMSGVHFLVAADPKECYLVDLESRNGTRVNDRRVEPNKRVRLEDQDQIRAGNTRFLVTIEGATLGDTPGRVAPRAAASHREIGPERPEPKPPERPNDPLEVSSSVRNLFLDEQPKVAFSAEPCASGLTLYRGDALEIAPHDVAARVSELYPVCLIVDFNKSGSPPPEALVSWEYLFDWFDEPVAAVASPRVVTLEDCFDWPAIVAQHWGHDAVVCLFSGQEKTALLEHLRRMCRPKHAGREPSGGMVGYCWPSVLAPLLSLSTSGYVGQLVEGIDAVLVEFPDMPETWQIFGRDALAGNLKKLGFVERAAHTRETSPTGGSAAPVSRGDGLLPKGGSIS